MFYEYCLRNFLKKLSSKYKSNTYQIHNHTIFNVKCYDFLLFKQWPYDNLLLSPYHEECY